MLVAASQMQEQEVGDGTNTVIILAASLLENAEELIRMVIIFISFYIILCLFKSAFPTKGLTPTEIAEGYDLAMKKALEIMPDLVCDSVKDLRDINSIKKAVRCSVASKRYGDDEFLANLVCDASGKRYFIKYETYTSC